jgi:hypothetical protein
MTSESVILQMIVNRLELLDNKVRFETGTAGLTTDDLLYELQQIIELGKGVLPTPKPLPPLERLSEAGYALIDSED